MASSFNGYGLGSTRARMGRRVLHSLRAPLSKVERMRARRKRQRTRERDAAVRAELDAVRARARELEAARVGHWYQVAEMGR